MLSQDQIMPLLLEACPSFRAVWGSELDEEDRRLVYVCLGCFAKHLLGLKEQGRTAELATVVEVIERLHVEGDTSTKEAATVGLPEGVQNVWGNHEVATDAFEKLLLPQSRLWWQQLELFWSGAIPYVGQPCRTKQWSRRGETYAPFFCVISPRGSLLALGNMATSVQQQVLIRQIDAALQSASAEESLIAPSASTEGAGLSQEDMNDVFQSQLLRYRDLNESYVDAIANVLDRIVGWCRPELRLFETELKR